MDRSSRPDHVHYDTQVRGPTVADPAPGRSNALTSVVTPQAVLLQFRTAGIGSRVLAKLIDLVVQLIGLIAVSIAAGFSGTGSLPFILGAVGTFAVIFVYPATEAIMNGQTLGKRVLSIRVITTDGGPIRFRHAAIRSLIGFVEFFVLLPGGPIALISALLTTRSQRVGDLVAETVVVRDRTDGTSPVFFNPPPGAERLALHLDTTRLTHPQYGLLREYVLRRAALSEDAQLAVAADLCGRLADLGVHRPPEVAPPVFVAAVVFAHQRRFASLPVTGPQAPPPVGPPVTVARLGPPPPGRQPVAGSAPPRSPPVPGPPPTGPPMALSRLARSSFALGR